MVEAGFDYMRVNLFEGLDGFAFGEEGKRRVVLKEFIRRV